MPTNKKSILYYISSPQILQDSYQQSLNLFFHNLIKASFI